MNPEGAYAAVLSNGFQFNIVVSSNTIAVELWKKYYPLTLKKNKVKVHSGLI